MSFFYALIPLFSSYLTSTWVDYYFFPMIILAFICCAPRLFRSLFFWR